MQIASLLLFSNLVTASIHGVRRRQCAESPPPSTRQSSLADISSSPSSTAFDSGSTISVTAVSISSSTPNTETTVPEPFLLQIQARDPQSSQGRKRQESSGSYLEENSSTSPRCEQGALFQLLNGRLLKEGVVITASNPPRAQPLLEAGASRVISITFSLTDGILSWSNPRFPRQTASFCLLAGTVYVYFEDAPAACVDITLSFASLSECPGRQALPSTAASSTWSTVGSQLTSAPVLSSRPVSSVYDSSGVTSHDPGTSTISSIATGSTSEASPQGTGTRISYSLIATTVPSQTTFGASSQLTFSQTSLSTSNGAFLPPEGLSSFSSITSSPSPLSISAMDQSTELSPSSSSVGIRSSQSSLFLTSQRTSDVVRPSSSTFDSSRLQSEISDPTSTQSVTLSQDSTSFSSALASVSQSPFPPTPYSTSPDTGLSSSTLPSYQVVSSSQILSSSMQSSESSSAPAEGLSSSMRFSSLATTLTSSWSSPGTSDTSSMDVTTSASGSLQSVESATSVNNRESATSTETPSSSPATSISIRSISETSRSETSTSTPSTSETSMSGIRTLSSTPPSSPSSEGSTSSPTGSTGPLSSFPSSTTSSDITSSITSSSSYASSSSSSSSTPSSTPEPHPICPAGPENRLSFGFITWTAGSTGYTGRIGGDYIAFYATSPPGEDGLRDGYLYHRFSGLCVTAIAPTLSTSPKYNGAGVQLQPCGPLGQTPPEAQLFSGNRDPTQNNVGIVFRGDLATYQWYGSAFGSSDNAPIMGDLAYRKICPVVHMLFLPPV